MNWKKVLDKKEYNIFKKLNTPKKIQDYIRDIPINFEPNGDTCMSPRLVIKNNKAHCIEGAVLAAAILWFHGQPPLLLDLKTVARDFDHVVTLFKGSDGWGAISKTNHPVLRYREPVYATVRELAMSYFHEYFMKDGAKTMRSFSKPFDLKKYGSKWITSEEEIWDIPADLDDSPHISIISRSGIAKLRKAEQVEIDAFENQEWRP